MIWDLSIQIAILAKRYMKTISKAIVKQINLCDVATLKIYWPNSINIASWYQISIVRMVCQDFLSPVSLFSVQVWFSCWAKVPGLLIMCPQPRINHLFFNSQSHRLIKSQNNKVKDSLTREFSYSYQSSLTEGYIWN